MVNLLELESRLKTNGNAGHSSHYQAADRIEQAANDLKDEVFRVAEQRMQQAKDLVEQATKAADAIRKTGDQFESDMQLLFQRMTATASAIESSAKIESAASEVAGATVG